MPLCPTSSCLLRFWVGVTTFSYYIACTPSGRWFLRIFFFALRLSVFLVSFANQNSSHLQSPSSWPEYDFHLFIKIIRAICFSTEWLKIVVKKEWNKSKICTRWNVTFYSNWTSWNWSAKRYIYVFLLAAISRERWIRIDSRLVLLVR